MSRLRIGELLAHLVVGDQALIDLPIDPSDPPDAEDLQRDKPSLIGNSAGRFLAHNFDAVTHRFPTSAAFTAKYNRSAASNIAPSALLRSASESIAARA